MRSEEEINIKINSLYQELKDKLSNELYSKEEKKIFFQYYQAIISHLRWVINE